MTATAFQQKCVHCEHYALGACCFCAKELQLLKKTPAEHLADVQEDNEIDI